MPAINPSHCRFVLSGFNECYTTLSSQLFPSKYHSFHLPPSNRPIMHIIFNIYHEVGVLHIKAQSPVLCAYEIWFRNLAHVPGIYVEIDVRTALWNRVMRVLLKIMCLFRLMSVLCHALWKLTLYFVTYARAHHGFIGLGWLHPMYTVHKVSLTARANGHQRVCMLCSHHAHCHLSDLRWQNMGFYCCFRSRECLHVSTR